jgi:hypothetical protein
MSIRVIQWVWDHSTAEGLDRLVLLAIADCANDHGRDAYPGFAELARKSRIARSTLGDVLKRLRERGHIQIQEAGGGRGHRTVYRVVMVLEEPSEQESGSRTDSYPEGGGTAEKLSGSRPKLSGSRPKLSGVASLTSGNANNRPEPSLTNGARARKQPPNRSRPKAGRCPHGHKPNECWQCPRPLGTPAPISLAETLRRGKLNGGAA